MGEEPMSTGEAWKGASGGGAIPGLRVRVIPSGVRLFYAVFWPVLALAWGGFFLWTGQVPAAVVCGAVTVAAVGVTCWQLFGRALELSEDQCVLRGVLPGSTRVIGRVGEVILHDLPDGRLQNVLFLGEISAAVLPAYPSVRKALQWLMDRDPDLPVTHTPAEKYQPPFFPAFAGMLGSGLLAVALVVAVAERRPVLGMFLVLLLQAGSVVQTFYSGRRRRALVELFFVVLLAVGVVAYWCMCHMGLIPPPR